eukprot:GHVH01004567.1.p1 GENE.GHVH01004567.1~~GHVH01004567.1.p1  ORF type:complete len:676 (+),score=50.65 GHVH01004567.1:904-2931(+)
MHLIKMLNIEPKVRESRVESAFCFTCRIELDENKKKLITEDRPHVDCDDCLKPVQKCGMCHTEYPSSNFTQTQLTRKENRKCKECCEVTRIQNGFTTMRNEKKAYAKQYREKRNYEKSSEMGRYGKDKPFRDSVQPKRKNVDKRDKDLSKCDLCTQCKQWKSQSDFSRSSLKSKTDRKCRSCVSIRDKMRQDICFICFQSRPWCRAHPSFPGKVVCPGCIESGCIMTCCLCQEVKKMMDFPKKTFAQEYAAGRFCLHCADYIHTISKQMVSCQDCGVKVDKHRVKLFAMNGLKAESICCIACQSHKRPNLTALMFCLGCHVHVERDQMCKRPTDVYGQRNTNNMQKTICIKCVEVNKTLSKWCSICKVHKSSDVFSNKELSRYAFLRQCVECAAVRARDLTKDDRPKNIDRQSNLSSVLSPTNTSISDSAELSMDNNGIYSVDIQVNRRNLEEFAEMTWPNAGEYRETPLPSLYPTKSGSSVSYVTNIGRISHNILPDPSPRDAILESEKPITSEQFPHWPPSPPFLTNPITSMPRDVLCSEPPVYHQWPTSHVPYYGSEQPNFNWHSSCIFPAAQNNQFPAYIPLLDSGIPAVAMGSPPAFPNNHITNFGVMNSLLIPPAEICPVAVAEVQSIPVMPPLPPHPQDGNVHDKSISSQFFGTQYQEMKQESMSGVQ